MAHGGFSCEPGYLLCRPGRSLAVLSDFSRPTSFNQLFRQLAAVSHLGLLSCPRRGYRNLNRFHIGCASRLPLSPRLTLIRLTLFRNPWACGAEVSTPVIVTYAYIFVSARSSAPRGTPSQPCGMLPYRACLHAPKASAAVFMPAHHPRVAARLVSCYALFE